MTTGRIETKIQTFMMNGRTETNTNIDDDWTYRDKYKHRCRLDVSRQNINVADD